MQSYKKGFTLIELLVVIAIAGLLLSAGLASVSVARAKGRDARRISDALQMRSALTMYQLDNGGFPMCALTPDGGVGSTYTYVGDISTCLSSILTIRDEKSHWWDLALVKIADAAVKYIGKIPTDPINSAGSVYYYATGPKITGSATNISNTATFYYVSESKSTGTPYKEGISVGTPDLATFPITGYPGALHNTLGSGLTPSSYGY